LAVLDKNNFSQKRLAKKLNYSRSAIANYEQNTRIPSVEVIIRIAKFFDVSSDYLLGLSNNCDILKNNLNGTIKDSNCLISLLA